MKHEGDRTFSNKFSVASVWSYIDIKSEKWQYTNTHGKKAYGERRKAVSKKVEEICARDGVRQFIAARILNQSVAVLQHDIMWVSKQRTLPCTWLLAQSLLQEREKINFQNKKKK